MQEDAAQAMLQLSNAKLPQITDEELFKAFDNDSDKKTAQQDKPKKSGKKKGKK